MKNNLGMFCGLLRLGLGATVLVFCAFTPVSRADVIVNNMGDARFSNYDSSSAEIAQVFTMSGTSGNLSSLTLSLDSTLGGTANVYLFTTSSGAPTGAATILGTVTAGTSGNRQSISVSSLNGVTLTAGSSYAIALAQNSTVRWDNTLTTGSGGTGSLGAIYTSGNSGATWAFNSGVVFMQMNLQITPVPEVPMTGAVMGFGVLAIAVGGTLRRKLKPAVSSIA